MTEKEEFQSLWDLLVPPKGKAETAQGEIIRIALLQISPCKTAEENLEKGIRYCRKARESGADIALFPEMWSNGYNIYGRPVEEWKRDAVSAVSYTHLTLPTIVGV